MIGENILEEFILFVSCLFSFASSLISLLFFFRYRKAFFIHVFLIMLAFFLISTNSFYVILHGEIANPLFIFIFGGLLSLIFSYGIISFALDFVQISLSSHIRKIVKAYSIASFAMAVIMIVLKRYSIFLLNLFGIWLPTAFSLILALVFYKRINKGIFRKEKWIIIVLALINLAFSFFLHNLPFVFIITVSLFWFIIFSIVFLFLLLLQKLKKLFLTAL